MARYKFFSTKYMLQGHIKAIKRKRSRLITDKLITYDDGSFMEHTSFGQPMYIMPKDDEILNELDNLLITKEGRYCYHMLSKLFKSYLRAIDEELYNKEFSLWKANDKVVKARQDIAIDKAEEKFDRELFESELMQILSGENIKFHTPTYLKAKRSNSRAYKTVLELIRANLNKFEDFTTLTFALEENKEKYELNNTNFEYVKDAADFEEVKKVFSKFINTMTKNMRRNGIEFEYIAVFEQHKNGRYHFHMLSTSINETYQIACPEWLDKNYKTGKRRNGKMLQHWKYGKSDVEKIRDKERMSTYLVKYLVKSFMSLNNDDDSYEEFMGKRKYFCSKGLKRPTVEYFDEKDIQKVELVEKKKAEYTDIYSTTYNNPYSDKEINRTLCSKPL